MKILLIGDIVGNAGVKKVKQGIEEIKKKQNIDFIIANGENAADGMGITAKIFNDLMSFGVNVVTMGNHTWGKKDIFSIIKEENLIVPANFSRTAPGKGYNIYNCNDKKIAVINLIGRVDVGILSDNPFVTAEKILQKVKEEADIIIVDFHAEATAEKIAMGYFLDGKVSVVFGTHTHVQTADEKILENGTAYITDIGMTGPKKSVIGMDVDTSVKRFYTTLPERYKVSSDSNQIMDSVLLSINDETCRVEKIERINL